MCIIVYSPKGNVLPSRELLDHCWEQNPHGAGFMYINQNNRIQIEKYMDKAVYLDNAIKTRTDNPESPFIMHMRWATFGDKTISNVHPFRINKSLAFCHNGTINKCEPPKTSNVSDTRLFRDKILRKLPGEWFGIPLMGALLTKYIENSRMIFLHRYGGVLILGEDKGEWVGDNQNKVWFSNDYYKMKRVTVTVVNDNTTTTYVKHPDEKQGKYTSSSKCDCCSKTHIYHDMRDVVFKYSERPRKLHRADLCNNCYQVMWKEDDLVQYGSPDKCIICDRSWVAGGLRPFNKYECIDLTDKKPTTRTYCYQCMTESTMWKRAPHEYSTGWCGEILDSKVGLIKPKIITIGA